MRPGCSALAVVCALLAGAGVAWAQDPPKFEFGKKEDVKQVEWKAAAQGGLVITTGNSRTTTLSAGATASRKAGDNKLSIDFNFAYARSDAQIASDTNGIPGIGPNEIQTFEQTTSNASLIKGRYDRFLTDRNSLYAAARVGADRPAGKALVAGAQVGYSRLALKTTKHEIAAEVGYDFSHEDYVTPNEALRIHSARLFVGYVGQLAGGTGLTASGELLTNLNPERAPGGDIDAFRDDRLLGKLALTTKLARALSFRLAFTAKYDTAPAPRAPFPGVPFEAGYAPLAEKLDTITELQFIVTIF